MATPSEQQHSGHRILTPPRFARWLARRVRRRFGVRRIAVLYCAIKGPYPLMPDLECWPIWAEHYTGPYPVIAHPPCGPWGPCRTLCKYQMKQGGIDAIEIVHRWGGVIEQPIGSTLFREYGRPGSRIEVVNQADWGHPIHKPTQLYWVG